MPSLRSSEPPALVKENPEIVAVVADEARSEQAPAHGLNETLSQLLEDVIESGETDQLRGYANETMGGTKLAVGRAIESPELTFAGIAQAALGAIQRYVGEEKMTPDDEKCAEARRGLDGRPTAEG